MITLFTWKLVKIFTALTSELVIGGACVDFYIVYWLLS